ncbi:hypothetical protein ABZ820_16285 [Streptomyces diacarni]|uniref:Uncharacterized protein n=2 Tax=Streptomyces TaxID=1883 RepID=A0A367F6M1_9ACTN|nr:MULTISPECIES: hypothetical protein [Streptomyces]RCG26008.1 hypothetical protein DTL70_07990 [Streptomyces diacarni]UNS97098.1 hypothetical protein MMF93_11695 [Streptomyces tubbatahanensis]
MEAAEARAALARRDAVQGVGRRAHAEWYGWYLLGFLVFTLLLLGAAAAARTQPAVGVTLNAVGAVLGIAAMGYAGTRPVVTRDFRRFHAVFSLGWTVLYVAAVVVGSVWSGGAPAAWWWASFVVLGAWSGGAALLARRARGRR